MFENKRRKNIATSLIVFGTFIILVTAFAVGYFLNISPSSTDDLDKIKGQQDPFFKIPDALAEVGSTGSVTNTDKAAATAVLTFNTYYPICGHSVVKTIPIPQQAINMNRISLQKLYPNWEISSFSNESITLRRELTGLCPDHFIIGAYDGYVTIYTYNDNGEKMLKEKTDISLSTLTPEDQSSIESGIIVDTEEDLAQKLEGLSN